MVSMKWIKLNFIAVKIANALKHLNTIKKRVLGFLKFLNKDLKVTLYNEVPLVNTSQCIN